MQQLRQQVNLTDRQILRLLRQRTKLSRQIGETKRLVRADIFVPAREREVLEKIDRQAGQEIGSNALRAIYREILSSSRAVQGQAPVGLLASSAAQVYWPGRWRLGASEPFRTEANWDKLLGALVRGTVSFALVTGQDLAAALTEPKTRAVLLRKTEVIGDFSPTGEGKCAVAERIYLLGRRGSEPGKVNRILVLIECKSTVIAVKTLTNFMTAVKLQVETLSLSARKSTGTPAFLVRAELSRPLEAKRLEGAWQEYLAEQSLCASTLGQYMGTESYGR